MRPFEAIGLGEFHVKKRLCLLETLTFMEMYHRSYFFSWVDCFGYLLLGCSVYLLLFVFDFLIYAFGWSAFLGRIRFCDTLVVTFLK
jgi:hypothetical protein